MGNPSTSPQLSWLNRDWVWGLVLVLAVFAVYSPVCWAGFIWDDDLLVISNPVIAGPLGLKEIWTTNAADICPLTLSTFWLEHKLWGAAPLGYHLVNVVFHAASALVLWRVLRKMQIPGAWLGAAMWAVHPVMVESVAWTSELKNAQSGLFFLLSIFFYVKFLEAQGSEKRKKWNENYVLTLLFAVLAMTSKSSTVMLPIVLCLCAWWMEGRWQWRHLLKLTPIFAMSFIMGLVSISTQKLSGPLMPKVERSWPERIATSGDAPWFYLGKLAWPYPLSAIYPHWRIDAAQWSSYLPLLALLTVLLFFWLYRKSWSRTYLFVSAFFLVALLPVLGLIDNTYSHYSAVADHFQYLAGMGPLALAGAGMYSLAQVFLPGRPVVQSTLGAVLLLVLGGLSWQRVWVFESEKSLWSDIIKWNPSSPYAYYNLGLALQKEGQMDAAMQLYQTAAQIQPDFIQPVLDLGDIYLDQHRVDEAIAQFQSAVHFHPESVVARDNLGVTLSKKGRTAEAMAQLQTALNIDPRSVDSLYNLAIIYAQTGRGAEALAGYRKVLEIDPGHAASLNGMGNVLLQQGRIDEAAAAFEKAVEVRPNVLEPHYNLGRTWAQKGRLNDAVSEYQKALEIDPDFVIAYNDLGVAFARQGRLPEAILQFQEALRRNPDYADAKKNLAQAQQLERAAAGRK